MNTEEIKKKYKDEWVLIEVTKVNELGQPLEGSVIAHSRNRDETYSAMKKTKANHIGHFYTGEITDQVYALTFLCQK